MAKSKPPFHGHGMVFLAGMVLAVAGTSWSYDYEGPRFIEEPPTRVEFSNERGIDIICRASGDPQPGVRWMDADGRVAVTDIPKIREVSPDGSVLSFLPFQPVLYRFQVHSAVYRCLASNTVGSILSHHVQVKAVVWQNAYQVKVEDQTVTFGNTAVFNCDIPQYVAEDVTVTSWFLPGMDNRNIFPTTSDYQDERRKYVMTPEGSLLVFNATAQDNNTKVGCRTVHRLSGNIVTAEPSAKLLVVDGDEKPPEIVWHPSVEATDRDSSIHVTCVAQGNPVPDVMIRSRPGNPYGTTVRVVRSGRGWAEAEVTIPSGAAVDPGASSSFQADSITGGVDSSGATKSGSASGSSGLHSSFAPSWNHGGFIHPHQQGFDGLTKGSDAESKVSCECVARNWKGEARRSCSIKFVRPLLVHITPSKLVVDVGKRAELHCSISGPAGEITWLKNGREIEDGSTTHTHGQQGAMSDHSRVRFTNGKQTLVITRVQDNDQGVYQCFARNSKESAQAAARLILGDNPPLLVYKMIDQTIGENTAVSMKCSATGRPTPTIEWTLNGFLLREIPEQLARYMTGQYVTSHGIVVSHVNISSATSREGGFYSCTARNSAGQTSHAAHLRVYGPPYVRDMPPQTAIVGKDFSISCPVGGHPIQNITWKRENSAYGDLADDGRFIVHPNGSLTVRFIKKADGGRYYCRAISPKGQKAENFVALHPAETPNLASLSVDPDLKIGDRATLNCVVKGGDVPVSLVWFKDDLEIGEAGSPALSAAGKQQQTGSSSTPAQHHPMTSQHTINRIDDFTSLLTIRNITVQHTGNYSCVARNRAGQDKRTVTLQVNVGPEIGPFTFGTGLREGQRVQVLCHVNQGDPPMRLSWLREPALPTLPSRTTNLTFNTLQELDSGLEVLGITVQKLDGFSIRLIISDLTRKHAGNYTCQAKNAVGMTQRTAELVVSVPPHWTSEAQPEKFGLIGHRVVLDCSAEAFPEPKVVWKKYKAGELDQFQELQTVVWESATDSSWIRLKNQSLLTPVLTKSHEGRYMCRVDNGVGSPLIRNFLIQVKAPPALDESSMPKGGKYSFRLGKDGTLTCVAQGDPPLSISWFYRGMKIPTDDISKGTKHGHSRNSLRDSESFSDEENRLKVATTTRETSVISKLSISSVRLEDSGMYRCEAENPFGRSDQTFELTVLDVPSEPQNVTVDQISSRSFTVRWRSPAKDGNSVIKKYMICLETKATVHSSCQEEINHDTTSTWHQIDITRLSPSTVYLIRVSAENGVGKGVGSPVTAVVTKEEPPSQAPTNLTAEAITSRDIRVYWHLPDKSTWNGDLLGIYVGVKEAEAVIFNFTVLPMKSTPLMSGYYQEYTVENLRPFTDYDVALRVYNSQGSSPLSRSARVKTLEDGPEVPPNLVQCKATSSSTVTVTWHPIPSRFANGVLIGYDVDSIPVHMAWKGDKALVRQRAIATAREAVIHSLKIFTNYSVQVSGATRAGNGPKSSPVYCMTQEDKPGPPSAIKVAMDSATSVIIAWSEPKDPNGILLGYKLYIEPNPTNASMPKAMYSVGPRTLDYRVTQLSPGKLYEAWVTGFNSAGEGQQSATSGRFSAKDQSIPAAIVSFGGLKRVTVATDVELDCFHVGDGHLNLQWHFEPKGGLGFRLVNPSQQRVTTDQEQPGSKNVAIGSKGTLYFRPVQAENAGVYSCTISNDMATDSITYTLQVLEPPKPPMITIVEEVSEGKVRVTWTPPHMLDSDPPLTNYQVFFRHTRQASLHSHDATATANSNIRVVHVDAEHTAVVLKNLTCGTPYIVYAKAVNEIGASERSHSSRVQIQGDLPMTPEADSGLMFNGTETLILLHMWLPRGCPILFFSIAYRLLGSHDWIIVASKVEPNQTEFRLKGLDPNMEYEIRTTAHSAPGPVVAVYRIGPSTLADKSADYSEHLFAPFSIEMFSDPVVFVPVIGSFFTILIVIAGVCCFVRCQPDPGILPPPLPKHGKLPGFEDVPAAEFDFHQRLPDYPELPAHPRQSGDEISPYAVFEMGKSKQLMQQQTMDGSSTLNIPRQSPKHHHRRSTGGTSGQAPSPMILPPGGTTSHHGYYGHHRRSVPEFDLPQSQSTAGTMQVTLPGDHEGATNTGGGYSIPYATSRDSALASSLDTLRMLDDGNSATRKLTSHRGGHQEQVQLHMQPGVKKTSLQRDYPRSSGSIQRQNPHFIHSSPGTPLLEEHKQEYEPPPGFGDDTPHPSNITHEGDYENQELIEDFTIRHLPDPVKHHKGSLGRSKKSQQLQPAVGTPPSSKQMALLKDNFTISV